eukprot:gene4755-6667_t
MDIQSCLKLLREYSLPSKVTDSSQQHKATQILFDHCFFDSCFLVIKTILKNRFDSEFQQVIDDNKFIIKYQDLQQILTVMCQIFANLVNTCGKFNDNINVIADRLFGIGTDGNAEALDVNLYHLQDLLALINLSNSLSAFSIFIHIVYSCIRNNSKRTQILFHARQFLCQYLLTIVDLTKENSQNEMEDLKKQKALSSVLEWMQIFGFHIWRSNLFFSLFNSVSSSNKTSLGSRGGLNVTHEQLIVIQLCLTILEDPYCSAFVHENESQQSFLFDINDEIMVDIDTKTILLDYNFSYFIIYLAKCLDLFELETIIPTAINHHINTSDVENNQLKTDKNNSNECNKIENQLDYKLQETKIMDEFSMDKNDKINSTMENIDNQILLSNYKTYLTLTIQVIAMTLSIVPKGNETDDKSNCIRNYLVKHTNIIHICLKIITNRNVNARLNGNKSYQNGNNEEDVEYIKLLVRSCLQLIGNLMYGCRVAQDTLRTIGGLAVVLSHCATDFQNPIAREWALLCVRNACENNLLNQEYIESLKPQDIKIQDEEMKAKGLHVEMDKSTGKFKFHCETNT